MSTLFQELDYRSTPIGELRLCARGKDITFHNPCRTEILLRRYIWEKNNNKTEDNPRYIF
ncbi:MAG: hypothetical protein K9M94_15270 [Spirochaetia bacterium]|nr:hypothetical protein [Spirochaetia bacterium]